MNSLALLVYWVLRTPVTTRLTSQPITNVILTRQKSRNANNMKTWQREQLLRKIGDYLDDIKDFGNIKLQHVLYSILQCDDRTRTTAARSLQFQLHYTILKTLHTHAQMHWCSQDLWLGVLVALLPMLNPWIQAGPWIQTGPRIQAGVWLDCNNVLIEAGPWIQTGPRIQAGVWLDCTNVLIEAGPWIKVGPQIQAGVQ